MLIWDLRSNKVEKIINLLKKNWVLRYYDGLYSNYEWKGKKINISVKWGKYAIFMQTIELFFLFWIII